MKKLSTRQKGNRAEDMVCEYLVSKGYSIQERNYLKKWGEIDIIGVKDGILHFFEVKSVTTKGNNGYRPEENVHNLKVRKLRRTVETYLNERKYGNDAEFLFHVITVTFFENIGKTDIDMIENVIL